MLEEWTEDSGYVQLYLDRFLAVLMVYKQEMKEMNKICHQKFWVDEREETNFSGRGLKNVIGNF